MSEMLANNLQEELEKYAAPRERVRSPQEILARYNQALMAYKELSFSSGDVRTQKLMTYNEIKVLGWVLGKREKTIIKEVAEHSNNTPFGNF